VTLLADTLFAAAGIGVAGAGLLPLVARSKRRGRELSGEKSELERKLRQALADSDQRQRAVLAELRHMGAVRLAELGTAITHPHVQVSGLLDPRLAATETDTALTTVQERVRELVLAERLRVDEAAKAVMRGTMGKVQALHYQQQTFVQEMQERFDEPEVAEALLRLDEMNERVLRLIQDVAVVCGRWPGLARGDSPVTDIVKGAASRVVGYQRVETSYRLRGRLGVVARAVEPLAMILAELLDNALGHSPSDVRVEVDVIHGAAGLTFFVTDWGPGMNSEELDIANSLLTGDRSLLFVDLEGKPPSLGFAVIGELVRRYGFRVQVETARSSDGVRTAVLVPDELLVALPELAGAAGHGGGGSAETPVPDLPRPARTPRTPPAVVREVTRDAGPAPAPASVPAAPGVPAPAAPSAPAVLATGDRAKSEVLPQRRRRSGATRAPIRSAVSGDDAATGGNSGTNGGGDPGADTAADSFRDRDPQENAARWGKLQSGTAAGRRAVVTPDGDSEMGEQG
jgi:signal transduction histidine kinase